MTRRNNVDRTEEIGVFRSMVLGDITERILFIKASSGVGKTRLLEEFRRNFPNKAVLAVIDFKNSSFGLANLLDNICLDLGREHFAELSACVSQFAGLPSTVIDRNTLLGVNRIQSVINMNALDEETRGARRAMLINAFFSDLRQLGRVVIIFDTYNDCDPSLRRCFSSTFLKHVCHTPDLVVVIAGQEVPEPNLDWLNLYRQIDLRPIEAKYWHQYAQQLDAPISLETMIHICGVTKGHALTIANYIESQAPQERFG